jgi:hypothetical protein
MVGQINCFPSSWIYDSYLHDYKLSYAKIYFNDGICILWTWLMKRAYEAIKEEYKFYSYGDAMLII